jgi:hypothetical protein
MLGLQMAKRKLLRRKGIFWEYNEDGQRATEKFNKFWKRYWRKWKMRLLKSYD